MIIFKHFIAHIIEKENNGKMLQSRQSFSLCAHDIYDNLWKTQCFFMKRLLLKDFIRTPKHIIDKPLLFAVWLQSGILLNQILYLLAD